MYKIFLHWYGALRAPYFFYNENRCGFQTFPQGRKKRAARGLKNDFIFS